MIIKNTVNIFVDCHSGVVHAKSWNCDLDRIGYRRFEGNEVEHSFFSDKKEGFFKSQIAKMKEKKAVRAEIFKDLEEIHKNYPKFPIDYGMVYKLDFNVYKTLKKLDEKENTSHAMEYLSVMVQKFYNKSSNEERKIRHKQLADYGIEITYQYVRSKQNAEQRRARKMADKQDELSKVDIYSYKKYNEEKYNYDCDSVLNSDRIIRRTIRNDIKTKKELAKQRRKARAEARRIAEIKAEKEAKLRERQEKLSNNRFYRKFLDVKDSIRNKKCQLDKNSINKKVIKGFTCVAACGVLLSLASGYYGFGKNSKTDDSIIIERQIELPVQKPIQKSAPITVHKPIPEPVPEPAPDPDKEIIKLSQKQREIYENTKFLALNEYQSAIIMGQNVHVMNLFDGECYSSEPDGTGKLEKFDKNKKYTIGEINLYIQSGDKKCNDTGKTLNDALNVYPNSYYYSIQILNGKDGSPLGYVSQKQYENLILCNLCKMIKANEDPYKQLSSLQKHNEEYARKMNKKAEPNKIQGPEKTLELMVEEIDVSNEQILDEIETPTIPEEVVETTDLENGEPETTTTTVIENEELETTTTTVIENEEPETTTTIVIENEEPETTTTTVIENEEPETTTTTVIENEELETTTTMVIENETVETTTIPTVLENEEIDDMTTDEIIELIKLENFVKNKEVKIMSNEEVDEIIKNIKSSKINDKTDLER